MITAPRASPDSPAGVAAHAPAAQGVPFVADLGEYGDRPAIITDERFLTYRELAARVADAAAQFGTQRRLVLVEGYNDLDTLVWYLGALAAGNAVLLVPGDDPSTTAPIIDRYDPDVLIRSAVGTERLDVRRDVTAHDLHPDLALLLSTSGSTGSPKLVRLSHDNLQANAEAIAACLGIRETDRAATTLPMHYCYGLSVIHSHLLRGAGLVLTDLSVVDACFWDLVRDAGATTFAGVPHTFELLDRVGFAEMFVPSLRYVTQAGGRMAPDDVRRYGELGQRKGFDLIVMYGATEATARMAYLPPEHTLTDPASIGRPIPGGAFTVEPVDGMDDADAGELVYHGRNVMLGYAQTPAELGIGRTVTELRTGDLARRNGDGLYEIIGRRSRFVKIVGLRVDLDHVERTFADLGHEALCAGGDGELAVALAGPGGVDPVGIETELARRFGVPRVAVRVGVVPELPRLANGKPDYGAVRTLAGRAGQRHPDTVTGRADVPTLVALYGELLGRGDVTPDSTFVGLGGDSLSYVEMSVRLEQALGQLPIGWHTTPIRDLTPAVRNRRRLSLHTVETTVAMRAMAIVMIVGTHIGLYTVPGGAHALLAVAGFNFARFQLTAATGWERIRRQLVSIGRIVVPSVAFIAVAFALTTDYSPANLVLLNNVFGPETWTSSWHFWFVEVLVQLLVLMVAVMAIPWVSRLERAHQFGFAVGLLGIGMLLRYEIVEIGLTHTKPALWLFAIGWAVARASARWQRLLLSAVVLTTVPGFFDSMGRNLLIVALLLLLVWAPTVVVPEPVRKVAGVLASASLYIYLVHWLIYPLIRDFSGWLALVASLMAGIGYWLLATRAVPAVWHVWGRAERDGV